MKMMEGDLELANHQQHQKKDNNGGSENQKKDNNGGSENRKKDNNGGSGGRKTKEATVTVVMKVDFHCQGCESKIFECARNFRGAQIVKVEADKSRLTVIGKVDPLKLHQKLEKSTKKKIELVSPQPKKNDNKHEKDKNNNKPKELPVTTVVFKMSLHCDGCCKRIRDIIRKAKGVHTVEIDREKELVTVRGAVDPKAVQERLKKKMKRSAEIVPAKKGKSAEKSEQCNGGGSQKLQQQKKCTNSNGQAAEVMEALMGYYGPIYGHIPSSGYVVDHLHAPQIFSDDNPNACSIM